VDVIGMQAFGLPAPAADQAVELASPAGATDDHRTLPAL